MRNLLRMQIEEAVERAVIGGRIRRVRKTRGLTALQLAGQLGISESHLFNIENGRSNATQTLRADICRVLELPADYFQAAS